MGLTIKERYDADVANQIATLTADDLIVVSDGTTGTTKIARLDALDTYAVIAGLLDSVTDLQAQISALSTDSSIVDIRGRSTEATNTGTVIQDLWPAGSDTRVQTDQLTYTHTGRVRNEMPVTDKTSVIITITSGSATITATTGTFALTDDGRLITGTGVPANTYITVATAGTTATLRTNLGVAVTSATPGTGITTVLHSPDISINYLLKLDGLNSFTVNIAYPPTGTGFSYLTNYDMTFTQGVDGLNHGHEGHLKVWNAGPTGSTGTPMSGLLVPEIAWYSDSTTVDMGTLRQSVELRIQPFKSAQTFYLKGSSLLMSSKGT